MSHLLLLTYDENTAPKKEDALNAGTGSGLLIIEGK